MYRNIHQCTSSSELVQHIFRTSSKKKLRTTEEKNTYFQGTVVFFFCIIAPSSVLRSRQERFMHSETITKELCFRPGMRTMTCHPFTHTSEKVLGLGPTQATITTLHFPLIHLLGCVCLCTFGLLSVSDLASSYPHELGCLRCVDLLLSDGE